MSKGKVIWRLVNVDGDLIGEVLATDDLDRAKHAAESIGWEIVNFGPGHNDLVVRDACLGDER